MSRENSTSRILMVANNFPPTRGGSAVVYANLAHHLASRVLVVAAKASYADGLAQIGWREHDRAATYEVRRLPLLRTQLHATGSRLGFLAGDVMIRLRLAGLIMAQVLTGGAHCVCVGELLASHWVLTLCRLLPGVRSVVYVHGEEITTEVGYDRGHNRARAALLSADAIIVVSRFTQQAVRTLLGEEGSKAEIHLIENGVDTQRFRPVGRRPDLVAQYRLQPGRIFVSVCRLLEKKGIDQAIRAFARVHRVHPDTSYVVVGTGGFEASLREIAAAEGVAERVIFTGDVTEDDLVAHYCLGDMFVMPNREMENGDTEGFGLVFLEANSCGLPVIAGSDGGSRDAVQHGVNGLVVNGRSVEAITQAMLDLLQDDALRARLIEGAQMVSQAADWRRKTEMFTAICEGGTLS